MATYQSTHTGAEIDTAVDAVSGKADKATTLAGYGITDATIENGVITLGANTITPLTGSVANESYYALYGGTALSPSSTNVVDLNNLVDVGNYYNENGQNNQYVYNKPVEIVAAFRLYVSAMAGTSRNYIRQRLQYNILAQSYERTTSNQGTSWSDWVLVQDNFSKYAAASDVEVLQDYFTDGVANSAASCTGNAATATTLETSRTIWGKSFDGSADISGDMTGVGSITTSNNKSINSLDAGGTSRSMMYLATDNDLTLGAGTIRSRANSSTIIYGGQGIILRIGSTGTSNNAITIDSTKKVGIGTATPEELLHVAGNVKITGNLILGSTTVAVVYSGSSAPSSSTGSDGDIYIQTS